jgi:hypothetical protein
MTATWSWYPPRESFALPWEEITRVVYQKGESHTEYSALGSRTVRIQYAFTQVWPRGATAPVTAMHVWRHKRMFRSIQARISARSAGGTVG